MTIMVHIFNICLVEFWLKKGQIVCLSPKCYMAYNEEDETTKAGQKGVPTSCKLTMNQFLQKLYHNENTSINMKSLRSVDGHMARTSMTKVAISDLFCKFRVSDDKITCTPLTENNKYL